MENMKLINEKVYVFTRLDGENNSEIVNEKGKIEGLFAKGRKCGGAPRSVSVSPGLLHVVLHQKKIPRVRSGTFVLASR